MAMNIDGHQGVLFLAYSTPKAWNNFLKESSELGLNVRELHLVDVTIPCDAGRYDEAVNWFKHFITPQTQRLVEAIPDNFMVNSILKKIEDKTNYKLMKNLKWDWKRDTKNTKLLTLMMPIACEYKPSYRATITSEKEKENYDKLLNFESDGFIPQTDKEAGISPDKMPEDMQNKLKEWREKNNR